MRTRFHSPIARHRKQIPLYTTSSQMHVNFSVMHIQSKLPWWWPIWYEMSLTLWIADVKSKGDWKAALAEIDCRNFCVTRYSVKMQRFNSSISLVWSGTFQSKIIWDNVGFLAWPEFLAHDIFRYSEKQNVMT